MTNCTLGSPKLGIAYPQYRAFEKIAGLCTLRSARLNKLGHCLGPIISFCNSFKPRTLGLRLFINGPIGVQTRTNDLPREESETR